MIKIIEDSYDKINYINDLDIVIGKFDGIHKGHKKILKENIINNNNNKACITFKVNPNSYALNKDSLNNITNKDDLKEYLISIGYNYLIIIDVDNKFINLSFNEFINFLKVIGTKSITCGKDFKFGKHKLGNTNHLLNDFNVHIVDDVKLNNRRISSSYIRESFKTRDIEVINNMIESIYKVKGIVVKGKQLGKTIGFPTLNIDYDNYQLPNKGVYAGKVLINNKKYSCMINIGNNPTFNHTNKLSLEVNVFDFNKNIYGEKIELEFIKFLRNEKKFNNINELINQLKIDKKNTEDVLNTKKV